MEQRGLLSRTTSGTGVQVTLSETGRAAVAAARPVHATAVRKHLIELVAAERRAEFGQNLRRLAES
jgi:DNA-binding MarR family transcriptional regulator